MALVVTIAGVARTRKLLEGSLRIQANITSRRDICTFQVRQNTGDSYVPSLGEEVVVMDGATKVFGGVIVKSDSRAQAFGTVVHDVECQDYTRLLDHKLVPDSFQDKTVDEIIASLAANYFPPGFTTTNVVAPVNVRFVGFNYLPLSKCLQQMAELINYEWYVDYDKDLHFFAKESRTAPFNINDGDGSYVYDSLVIRKDNSQVRNTIIVRGGEYLGSQLTAEIEANGVDFIFNLPYRFADFAATLTADPLSVGIDYLNQPDEYDALYNFQEKLLRFKEADTPSAGSVILVSGKPYLPVIVRYQASAHVLAMISTEGGDGVYEYLIEDRTINTKEGARQRAKAEVAAFAETLAEADFETYTAGLEPGQKIRVTSASRGIDEFFVINRVTATMQNATALKYRVSLVTTRTFDLIAVLQRLLLESTKKIEIAADETVDILLQLSDGLGVSDDVTASSTATHPYRYSNDAGTTPHKGVWDFSTWD